MLVPMPRMPPSAMLVTQVVDISTPVWVRLRSGVVLMVLLAVLGALLALAVGASVMAFAFAVRTAIA